MSKRLNNGDPITLIGWSYSDANSKVWIRWADIDNMMIEMLQGLDGTTFLLGFGLSSEGALWVRGHDVSSVDLRAALTAQALAKDW